MSVWALNILNREEMSFALQEEIRRSAEVRYDHRYEVLLGGAGNMLSAAVRAIRRGPSDGGGGVHRFEQDGFAGLSDREREGQLLRLSRKRRE